MKTIQWFLLLTRCHFQPLVTFGHSWLEMAPRERQKPFHFLHTSDGKQILIVLNNSTLNAGLSGDPFKFKEAGDGPDRYNIIHYKQTSRGNFQWVNVGSFDNGKVELDMSGKPLF